MIINSYSFGVAAASGYIVDDHSPEYCWTVERVKATETDLVLMRRSSDSAELAFNGAEISDGTLTTWTGTSAGDHGYIVTWYNQGSFGTLDPTQATAGKQPRLVIDGAVNLKNSQPSVLYDGVDDENTVASYLNMYQSPFSIFGVASNEASADIGTFFANRATGDLEGFLLLASRTTLTLGVLMDDGPNRNDFNYTAQLNNNNLRLHSFILDSSEGGEFWLDGTTQETLTLTGSYSKGTVKELIIGANTAGSAWDNVNVSMIVGYDDDQAANRSSIETDINSIYATY